MAIWPGKPSGEKADVGDIIELKFATDGEPIRWLARPWCCCIHCVGEGIEIDARGLNLPPPRKDTGEGAFGSPLGLWVLDVPNWPKGVNP